ncbi:nSTAND1 domain-containing NTPase [Mucilaginibacter ginsenosidivorax]|uniref:ATP-binding protein n=1 Tax=Mucilaginibacter ginsenosidivorax TaxID=862126 RepID=A0A5B8W778_9SPHI|nr:ATP-binding protein [Mucilaginibacter ginsenosidivorax]QEC79734.1 ATP-binding protein [Mucilaginibacter ginsenosidivorax]
MQSAIKFLDPYEKEDIQIFFGRQKESENLYNKVRRSVICVLYGVSGTGKTSLIQCGLANKFDESDWMDITVRRGSDRTIMEAILVKIKEEVQETPNDASPENILNGLKTIYKEYYRPLYLIFDQFEELFINGDNRERYDFKEFLKLLYAEQERFVTIILVLRDEFYSKLNFLKPEVPNIFNNSIELERISEDDIKDVITNIFASSKVTCTNENKIIDNIIANAIDPETKKIELPYLQVYLQKIFDKINKDRGSAESYFTLSIEDLPKNISFRDALGDFLDEEVSKLLTDGSGFSDEDVWEMLKLLITPEGTKRSLSLQSIIKQSTIPEKGIKVPTLLSRLKDSRILRLKYDLYELKHDSLAAKIASKWSEDEKLINKITKIVIDTYALENQLTKDQLYLVNIYKDKLRFDDADKVKYFKYIDECNAVFEKEESDKNSRLETEITLRELAEKNAEKAINERNKARILLGLLLLIFVIFFWVSMYSFKNFNENFQIKVERSAGYYKLNKFCESYNTLHDLQNSFSYVFLNKSHKKTLDSMLENKIYFSRIDTNYYGNDPRNLFQSRFDNLSVILHRNKTDDYNVNIYEKNVLVNNDNGVLVPKIFKHNNIIVYLTKKGIVVFNADNKIKKILAHDGFDITKVNIAVLFNLDGKSFYVEKTTYQKMTSNFKDPNKGSNTPPTATVTYSLYNIDQATNSQPLIKSSAISKDHFFYNNSKKIVYFDTTKNEVSIEDLAHKKSPEVTYQNIVGAYTATAMNHLLLKKKNGTLMILNLLKNTKDSVKKVDIKKSITVSKDYSSIPLNDDKTIIIYDFKKDSIIKKILIPDCHNLKISPNGKLIVYLDKIGLPHIKDVLTKTTLFLPKEIAFKGSNLDYFVTNSSITFVDEVYTTEDDKKAPTSPNACFITIFIINGKGTATDNYQLKMSNKITAPDNWQIDYTKLKDNQNDPGYLFFQNVSGKIVLKSSINLNQKAFTENYLDSVFSIRHR